MDFCREFHQLSTLGWLLLAKLCCACCSMRHLCCLQLDFDDGVLDSDERLRECFRARSLGCVGSIAGFTGNSLWVPSLVLDNDW